MKFWCIFVLLFGNCVASTWSGRVYQNRAMENTGKQFLVYKYSVPLFKDQLRSGSLISTYPMPMTHKRTIGNYNNDQSDYYNYLTEPEIYKPVITNRLSQVTNGINALKIGSFIVVAKLFIGVIILALITSAGTKFAPIVLPLFLLPVGFLTILFFIPVFIIALILVAIAHEQGLELRRKRRSIIENKNNDNHDIDNGSNNLLEKLNHISTQVEKSLDKFKSLEQS